MDTAMRDIEMIQERSDEESPGRKAAMLGMAGLSTIALVFAMGVMLGDGNEPDGAEPDPLAALAPAIARESATEPEATEEATEETLAPGEVRFHQQLVDDRPEVEAALAAAAVEQQMLESNTASAPAAMASAAPSQATETPLADLALAPSSARAEVPGSSARASAAGHDGAFTLQVVSYRTREEADLFADALRGRGHAAFIMRAEIPGRGTYFRVRIGPFDSRVAAERYRATFEQEEALNSYVVDSARVASEAAAD